MPINLAGARPTAFAPKLKTSEGLHPALFIGVGDTYSQVNRFPCEPCNGSGTNPKNSQDCYRCKGAGKKTDTMIPVRFEINGDIEEKHVTFSLSDGLGGGKASNLFLIFSAISGLRTASEIEQWAAAIPSICRIPCAILVERNQNDWLNITRVLSASSITAHQTSQVPPASNGHQQSANTSYIAPQAAQQTQRQSPPPNQPPDETSTLLRTMQRKMNELEWKPEYRLQWASDQLGQPITGWFSLDAKTLSYLVDMLAEIRNTIPHQQTAAVEINNDYDGSEVPF